MPDATTELQSAPEHRCVACGYNLYGLGEEPRCPECGLLNVPEGYRRQVWELVDSGKWFFSGFFSPFKKRPPGWWWSLDRPGDVKRAIKFAILSTCACAAVVVLVAGLVGSVTIDHLYNYSFTDPNDPSGQQRVTGQWVFRTYLDRSMKKCGPPPSPESFRTGKYSLTRSIQFGFHPNHRFLLVILPVLIGTFLCWALPAQVGLWTQIRKDLPYFARAPRTIVAASCYEAHRLWFLSIAFATWAFADLLARRVLADRPSVVAGAVLDLSPFVLAGLLAILSAIGWVGPVRSDYTKQLVRSRLHAVRIVLMYAVVLPLVFGLSILSSLHALLD